MKFIELRGILKAGGYFIIQGRRNLDYFKPRKEEIQEMYEKYGEYEIKKIKPFPSEDGKVEIIFK
jgi:hypothetical protein